MGNVARRFTSPDEAARAFFKLAEKYGVPMNLAQATGRMGIQRAEVWLDRMALSSGKIREARLQSATKFEDAANRLLDGLYKGSVTPDEFFRTSVEELDKLRNTFNGQITKQVGTETAKYAPRPVSAVQAGEAMQGGVKATQKQMEEWANKAFGELREVHGQEPISVLKWSDEVRSMLQSYPDQAQLRQFFPTIYGKLEKLSELSQRNADVEGLRALMGEGGDPAAIVQELVKRTKLDPNIADYMGLQMKLEARAGIDPTTTLRTIAAGDPKTSPAGTVTLAKRALEVLEGLPKSETEEAFDKVLQVRKELQSAVRGLTPGQSAAKRSLTKGLLSTLDSSIDTSLEGKPAKEAWTAARTIFRQLAQTLRGPVGKGATAEGSQAVRTIIPPSAAQPFPEQIPVRLTAPGSVGRIEQAQAATSPLTVPRITGEPTPTLPTLPPREPMDLLRRHELDKLVGAAEAPIEGGLPGAVRTSPSLLGRAVEKKTPETMTALYGPQGSQAIAGIAGPQAIARESDLYASPLARALGSEKAAPQSVLSTAFPPGRPEVATKNLSTFFPSPDVADKARRAYVQNIVQGTRNFARGIPSESELIDPARLSRALGEEGETLGAIAGPEAATGMNELAQLGEHMRRPLREVGTISPAVATMEAERPWLETGKLLGGLAAIGGGVGAGTSHSGSRRSRAAIGATLGAATGLLLPRMGARILTSPEVVQWAMRKPTSEWMRLGGGAAGAIGRIPTNLSLSPLPKMEIPEAFPPPRPLEEEEYPPPRPIT